ncbi:MAG: T9SS type A sorting domain-containing protein [Bacteroidales bacterium]|nr:T9SS type A sorting domain-containing protein [Bacteroidales bacterium]
MKKLFLILLLTITSFGFSQDPVAQWNFNYLEDQEYNVIWESIGGFSGSNGSIEQESVLTTSDRFDNDSSAYYFDNGIINIENLGNIPTNSMDSFTISLWVNFSFDGNGPFLTMISGSKNLSLSFYDNVVKFSVSSLLFNIDTIEWSGPMSDNYNIIITIQNYLGSYLYKIYYNSEQIFSDFYGNSILDYQLSTFKIGSESFKGTIDDITIYDRVLSQDEIDSIYNYNPTTYNKEIAKTEDLKIYPNPTNGLIKISGNDFKYAEIFNMQGRKLKQLSIINREINLLEFKKGLYLLRLINENEVVNEKIIIQ